MKQLWIAVLTAALMATAVAQPQTPTDGPGMMRRGMKFMKKLNLTEEQQKQVSDIHLNVQKQIVADRAKEQTARIELRQLLKADKPERSAIEKKMQEIADVTVQMKMRHVDGWYAINKLLNPDQQKQWKKMLEMAPMMAQGGRGKGMGMNREGGRGPHQGMMGGQGMPMNHQ